MKPIPPAMALVALLAMDAAVAADDAPLQPISTTPPGTRPQHDETLEAAVARALENDRRVNPMQVKVAVHEGLVTLTGAAKDVKEKDAAETVVRGVAGVRAVQNRLVVKEPGAPEPGTSVIPEVPAQPAH